MPPAASRPSRRLALAAGLWLAAGASLRAQPPTLPPPTPLPPAAAAPVTEFATGVTCVTRYTLCEALGIAHSRHPQLAALRASMNAALLKQAGLGEVKHTTSIVSGLVIPDYEVRMQQSDLGIIATRAELAQAEHEVTYGVVRCYYAVVYARAQAKVARDLVEHLEVDLEMVKRILQGKGTPGGLPGSPAGGPGGRRPVTKDTEDNLRNAVGQARLRLIQAESGADRARAALREAMGLDPLCHADAVDDKLPEIPAVIPRDAVIAHAVTRRGEVALAEIGADVSRLEVFAQWTRKLTLMANTFANASDIHARPLPAGHHDPDYKPAAIGPEMPERLLGKAETRAAAAGQYAARNAEVARHAKSLVALEAEVAWTRWAEAARKVAEAREMAAAGRALVNRQREAAGGAAQTEQLAILNEVSAASSFAALNEALYDQVIAIANLERVTAGGIYVGFGDRKCPGR